jgi:hypothetical protein
MMMDAIFERFVAGTPITVMAQLGLERVLDPAWLEQMFDEHTQGRQYERELLFSTVVDIVALVALGLQPSVHAAARSREGLHVSLSALYDKLNHTAPALGRALVKQSAERLESVVEQFRAKQPGVCPEYRVRIVDGNCLAPSEKRLKPLRKLRTAALPGRSLVVYDPDLCLVIDVLPSEDGHAGERALMVSLLPNARPGELWIADRAFCTYNIIASWEKQGACYLVRQHSANAKVTACDVPVEQGKTDSGTVLEHLVDCQGPEGTIRLRRIELRLNTPTEDGETVIGSADQSSDCGDRGADSRSLPSTVDHRDRISENRSSLEERGQDARLPAGGRLLVLCGADGLQRAEHACRCGRIPAWHRTVLCTGAVPLLRGERDQAHACRHDARLA